MAGAAHISLDSKSLSEQVSRHLLQQILDNTYPVGSQIPTETELQEIYGVSRTTIRDAILTLQTSGYLRRERGRGTFVQSPLLKEYIGNISSFEELVITQGMTPTTRVLSCTVSVPPEHVQKRLELGFGDTTICIMRLRFADREEVCIARDYVPSLLAPSLCSDTLESGSLYKTLEQKHGLTLTHALEEVEAIIPTCEDQDYLGMNRNMPALFLRRITFGRGAKDNIKFRAVHYVETVYRSDKFQYVARLEGRSPQPKIKPIVEGK